MTDALRVTITELAQLKGVTRQAISKRLARLVDEGLITVEQRGRERLVRLAEWDALTDDVTDLARVAGHATRAARRGESEPDAAGAPRDPSYTQELTRKARYDADLKEIELQRQRQELRSVAEVTDAATKIGEAMVRVIDMLPSRADDLATAVARGGPAAVRDQLRALARSMRGTIARELAALAAGDATPDDPDTAAGGLAEAAGNSTRRLPQ